MKIAVFGGHNDDLPTGMGGTIYRLRESGHDVKHVVTALSARNRLIGEVAEENVRTQEMEQSDAVLGISGSVILDFYIREVEANIERLGGGIARLLDSYNPDVIFTHSPIDIHSDHRVTTIAVIAYCYQKGKNIPLFFFEVLSGPGKPQTMCFFPTHYVDIARKDVQRAKKDAIYCHQSQDPASLWEAHSEMQRIRGKESGDYQSEAFMFGSRVGDISEELKKIFMPTKHKLPRGIGIDVVPEKIGL